MDSRASRRTGKTASALLGAAVLLLVGSAAFAHSREVASASVIVTEPVGASLSDSLVDDTLGEVYVNDAVAIPRARVRLRLNNGSEQFDQLTLSDIDGTEILSSATVSVGNTVLSAPGGFAAGRNPQAVVVLAQFN